MEIERVAELWVSSIDIQKSRVMGLPSLIFLCGGPVSKEGETLKSGRDIFYRQIKNSDVPFKKNVVLAEEVFHYFDNSAYTDLLRFEADLAYLSSLIIIFSESPGSIAELGSFAALKSVRNKILVVLHADDAKENHSFIWLGPVTHLKALAEEAGRQDPIAVYPWKSKGESCLADTDFRNLDDLVEILNGILAESPKSELWNTEKPEHIMLLILEVLRIIHLGTMDDIVQILNSFHDQIERRTIEQYVSLLVSVKYATKFQYGRVTYYSAEPGEPWISWKYTSDAEVRDQDRWASLFIEYYYKKHTRKYRALKAYRKPNIPLAEGDYVDTQITT